MLVPLQHVKINGVLESGHAFLDIQLTYANLGAENPIECTFEFPVEPSTVVSKLIATIDDKVVEAKIKAKEEAKEQYNDAIASGKTAVYAERSSKKDDEAITLLLGNLLPGQIATVDIQLIRSLKITGSAYDFTLPVYYFPQYKQHEVVRDFSPSTWFPEGALDDIGTDYTFEYSFELKSKEKISMVSAPEDSTKTKTASGYTISVPSTNKIPKRELRIFFKNDHMLEP